MFIWLMERRKLALFIALAVIAMLGIIMVQFFWAMDAHKHREELLKQRVKVALKSVSTRILDARIDPTANTLPIPRDTLAPGSDPIAEAIDAALLDSLLTFEMECMDISGPYRYGVFNERDSAFVMGAHAGYENEIISSGLKVSLACIYSEDVYSLGLLFPNQGRMLFDGMIFMVIMTLSFLVILIVGFSMLIRLMFRQKRLSEIKSDFINNMTHEFKTPIATISLTSELLLKPDVNRFPYKTRRYASVIFDENARLQKQVDQVLQLSVLEKGSFRLKKKEIDIHRIIRRMAEHFSVKVQKRGGRITTRLEAEKHRVKADRTHFSNILANLIDNAIKYTPEDPEIVIHSQSTKRKLLITITDNGIGISPENQQQVFKKLYRVPTGNIHDVKGFGLGLFYVKTMVEAHGGVIHLKSELNKGTSISIELPLDNEL
jgi:two-component system phosphate regulon sensor histidine kinase PhoR